MTTKRHEQAVEALVEASADALDEQRRELLELLEEACRAKKEARRDGEAVGRRSERVRVQPLIREATGLGVWRPVGDQYDVRVIVDKKVLDAARTQDGGNIVVDELAREVAKVIADGLAKYERASVHTTRTSR